MSNNTTIHTEVLRLFNNQVDNIQTIGNDFKRQVTDAYPSIYTKEDVMRLLDNVVGKYVAMMHDFADVVTDQIPSELESEATKFEFTTEISEDICGIIETCIDNKYESHIELDTSSAEFSINYNNVIELDHCGFEVDSNGLAEEIIKRISKYYNEKYFIEENNQ
jgi:hypothetical protein